MLLLFSGLWLCVFRSARYAHAVVAAGSTLVLTGGITWWDSRDVSRAPRDIWQSPDFGVTWTLLTDSAPFGIRQGASAVLVDQAMLIIAGDTLTDTTFGDGGTHSCISPSS